MKLIKFILSCILLFGLLYFATDVANLNFTLKAQAQTEPPSETKTLIPGPIKDLFQEFSKISDKISDFKFFKNFSQIKLSGSNDQGILESVINKVISIFKSINTWLENNIGLNFFKIIKIIGNVFIWSLEELVNLIRWGLKALPQS